MFSKSFLFLDSSSNFKDSFKASANFRDLYTFSIFLYFDKKTESFVTRKTEEVFLKETF